MRVALPYLLLYSYVSIQMGFYTLNTLADSGGGVNSYVIAIIILCFAFVLRPIHSVINVLLCAFYAFYVMFSTNAETGAWNSVMLTDTWANIIIITALVVVMSSITYQFYFNQVINAIRLEESIATAETLARRDSLTGLLNRRGFFEFLDEYWNKAQDASKFVVIVLFDVDHFKAYNDYYGHLAGDNCLHDVALSLQNYFEKQGGKMCRFGGEEFLGYFEAESKEEAFQKVENARMGIEDLRLPGVPTEGNASNVTASAGFFMQRVADGEYEDAVNKADIALYQSKKNGRNTTTEFIVAEDSFRRSVRSSKKSGPYDGTEKRRVGDAEG